MHKYTNINESESIKKKYIHRYQYIYTKNKNTHKIIIQLVNSLPEGNCLYCDI